MVYDKRLLKVLHVIDGLGGGGSERWIWDIVRLSNKDEVAHYVITIDEDDRNFVYARNLRSRGCYDVPERFVKTRDEGMGIASRGLQELRGLPDWVRSVGRPGLNILRMLKARLCTLRTSYRIVATCLRFKADVIHAHTFYGFSYALALKPLYRRPIIHTVPCLLAQMVDAGYDWMPWLYRRFHEYVDMFLTAYPGELDGLGITGSKIMELHAGVDLELVESAKSMRNVHRLEMRSELGIKEDAIICLSVGRLHQSKGHHYALEAVRLLRDKGLDAHLVVLGSGPERSGLESRTKELGLNGCTHFFGFVDDPLPWYAAGDVYLRTMIFEGENLSSYQAMAIGLPVVGFDTGCETELVAKVGHGVLVPNRDGWAMGDAAQAVLGLPDRGRSMGERGVAYSKKNLDVREAVEKFMAAYEGLSRKSTSLCRTV